ncbi:surface-anchored protein [Kribbella orskensis]|uniref:Surface-anchored protein n=2 Tax=Kribbellaceae TaxID=2726069 RepID=A0ABY2BA66_9ACTN|nr:MULTISPECIES: TIGR03769 domain-containing protein [Kribbella]TCN32726.1 surface-anchored protein [Kribbella sp. VKM Ac-2500]TCO12957.1 surface-anchored protein [Kribbella orskensis]
MFFDYDEFTGAVPRLFSSVEPPHQTLRLPVGRHGHANGSFSQLGTYKLTVQASATMAAGAAVTSWAVECTLVVGPYEPPMPPPTTLIGHHPILLP